MAVENTTDGIGDGLIGIITFDEHGIDAGDGALRKLAGPLEKAWELRIDGRRVATGDRRLTGCEADLTLRHRITGEGVHHEEDVEALVPEIFCNGRRDKRALES